MRLRVKTLFTGPLLKQFADEWNANVRKKSNRIYTSAVALWEDDADLQRLEALFEPYARSGSVRIVSRGMEAVYSNADLFSSDLLSVSFGGWVQIEDGDTAFQRDQRCTECHRAQMTQVRPLTVTAIEENRDASVIFSGDGATRRTVGWAVSASLRTYLVEMRVQGVDYRELRDDRTGGVRTDISQLLISARVPPLLPRSHIVAEKTCKKCGIAMNIHAPFVFDTRDAEQYFPRFDIEAMPIGLTEEVFGSSIEKFDGDRQIVMAPSLYRMLIEKGFTGIGADPAHFA